MRGKCRNVIVVRITRMKRIIFMRGKGGIKRSHLQNKRRKKKKEER